VTERTRRFGAILALLMTAASRGLAQTANSLPDKIRVYLRPYIGQSHHDDV